MNNLIEKYKRIPVQIKASFWFLICSFLQKGITFITTPIFTRIMNPVEYGKYSVFTSWQGIFSVFVSLNLWAGVYTRGLVKYEGERKSFVSSFQGLSFLLTLLWTIVYAIFRELINTVTGLTTVQMLSMLIIIWLTSVYNFWAGEQRVDYKYRELVIITIVVSWVQPIVGIIFVYLSDDKVTARILSIVLVELIMYSGLFLKQLLQGKQFFNGKFWKYALVFNIPLIPHYLSMTVLSSADRIMISKMIGNNEAGIYNLAYQISMIMTMLTTALMQTIEPWLYRKIKDRNIYDIKKVAYSTFTMVAVLNIILIALAPEIMFLFAPNEYFEAVWVIPPVAMSTYFMFAYTFFAVFEFYYSKRKFVSVATTIGAILNIFLNYIFINKFGYIAAGYTTLLCYVVYAVCHFIFMEKICKIYLDNQKPFDIKALLVITSMFVGASFLILFTYSNMWIRYILLICIMLAIVVQRKKIIIFVKQLINMRR